MKKNSLELTKWIYVLQNIQLWVVVTCNCFVCVFVCIRLQLQFHLMFFVVVILNVWMHYKKVNRAILTNWNRMTLIPLSTYTHTHTHITSGPGKNFEKQTHVNCMLNWLNSTSFAAISFKNFNGRSVWWLSDFLI